MGISVRKDEDGRLYPYSEDAKDVTEILTACACGEGVEIILNSGISRMEADPEGGFLLFVDEKEVRAESTYCDRRQILRFHGHNRRRLHHGPQTGPHCN